MLAAVKKGAYSAENSPAGLPSRALTRPAWPPLDGRIHVLMGHDESTARTSSDGADISPGVRIPIRRDRFTGEHRCRFVIQRWQRHHARRAATNVMFGSHNGTMLSHALASLAIPARPAQRASGAHADCPGNAHRPRAATRRLAVRAHPAEQ